MRNISKQSVTFILIASLVLIPFATTAMAEGTYQEENGKGLEMTVDILLARPLGIVATVVGSAVFLVSLPFSALGGNAKEAGKVLVVEPFSFTFTRPLGDFN
ncbi:MAG: hypothetical protein IMF07_07885 [Proteobacteria bacterium]|nr:hypothetical protein [Pseudomonadota bacterium]